MQNITTETRCGQTDKLTDRQTDIVTYRAAITALNAKYNIIMF